MNRNWNPKADWRVMTRAEIQANPMRYWRSRFLEARRAYPQHTKLATTEYGFMRACASKPTLAKLAQRERAIGGAA